MANIDAHKDIMSCLSRREAQSTLQDLVCLFVMSTMWRAMISLSDPPASAKFVCDGDDHYGQSGWSYMRMSTSSWLNGGPCRVSHHMQVELCIIWKACYFVADPASLQCRLAPKGPRWSMRCGPWVVYRGLESSMLGSSLPRVRQRNGGCYVCLTASKWKM